MNLSLPFLIFFLGDVSMTRADAAIGDNRNFNQTLFNEVGKLPLIVAAQSFTQKLSF
jgi:hypothetical protein